MMYSRTWQTTWQSDCQDGKQYPLWDTILKPVWKHMAIGKPITGEGTRGKCPGRCRNRERQLAIGRGDGDIFLCWSSKIDLKPTFVCFTFLSTVPTHLLKLPPTKAYTCYKTCAFELMRSLQLAHAQRCWTGEAIPSCKTLLGFGLALTFGFSQHHFFAQFPFPHAISNWITPSWPLAVHHVPALVRQQI